MDDILSKLIVRYNEVEVARGSVHSYLGVTLDFSVPDQVSVTMEGYVKDIISKYNVRRSAATPALDYLFEVRESPPLQRAEADEFHSRVAKLMYLAKRVRPDILTLCSFLSTRVLSPTEDDWCKLQRGLEYLYGTQDLGIVLECNKGPIVVKAYIDASYGVHIDARSRTGSNITLGRGPIFVKSSK